MKRRIQMSHAVVLALLVGGCGNVEPAVGGREVGEVIQSLHGALGEGWSQLSPGVFEHKTANGVVSQTASGPEAAKWRLQQLTSELVADTSSDAASALKQAELRRLQAIVEHLSADNDRVGLGTGGAAALTALSPDISYTCSASGQLCLTGTATWDNTSAGYDLQAVITLFPDLRKPPNVNFGNGVSGSAVATACATAACGSSVTGSGQVTIAGSGYINGKYDTTYAYRNVSSITCWGPPCTPPPPPGGGGGCLVRPVNGSTELVPPKTYCR